MAKFHPSKPHHTPSGFRNNYPHAEYGLVALLRWQWERLFRRRSRPSPTPRVTRVQNDLSYLQANGHETTVTWIGHSTLLLQVAGINLLTDPHLTDRASPLSWAGPKRLMAPGLAFTDLPAIHLVLLSHNHYDHLDLPTLRWLAQQPDERQPQIIVPLGLRSFLAQHGVGKVLELDWWQRVTVGDATIHAVPVQHFSARTPFDRNQTLWAGYVVEHPVLRFFFAGDTGYSADFEVIGRKFGPMDLSAIPIGAYEPRWFMHPMHVNPEEAVKIHQDVRSRRSVAIHWGTFELTDEPLDEPPKRLREALVAAGIAAEEFFVMHHGETRLLEAARDRPLASQEDAADHPAGFATPENGNLVAQA